MSLMTKVEAFINKYGPERQYQFMGYMGVYLTMYGVSRMRAGDAEPMPQEEVDRLRKLKEPIPYPEFESHEKFVEWKNASSENYGRVLQWYNLDKEDYLSWLAKLE